MKKKQNMLVIFATLLLLSISGWLAWQAAQYYAQRSAIQDEQQMVGFLNVTQDFLVALDREAEASAIYLAKKEKMKPVSNARAQTDAVLMKLVESGEKSSIGAQGKQMLRELSKELGSIRSQIDTFKDDARSIFLDGYYRGIAFALMQMIQQNKNFLREKNIGGILQDVVSIDQAYAAGGLERNFIIYHQLHASSIGIVGLILWEKILDENALPTLRYSGDVKMIEKIEKMINNPDVEAKLQQKRINFIRQLAKIHDPDDTDDLREVYHEKLLALNNASRMYLSSHRKSLLRKITATKQQMYLYAAGTALLVILLFILLWGYRSHYHESRLLEETLKDIEIDLNHEKRQELVHIIEQGDTKDTYAFLADTIRESNRAKDLFLANMSHEIRTPLNGIMGFTQLLKTATTDAEREEYIHVIEESSEMLLTIVNDILDLSKIKADKIELEEIAFDPLDKIESAVEAMGAKALLKEIEFGVYVDPQLPLEIMGDPTRLSQVLVNLIGNAIKFTPAHGQISLRCEQVADSDKEVVVRFSVQDTGIGISEKQQEKIFEAFSQADISTTRQYGGTGLGLSISSKLVSLMGGKLELDSVEGEGSIFYFTLAFKKGSDDVSREVHRCEGIRAGLLLPKRDIDRPVDRNLVQFLKHMGVDASFFYEDEIYTLGQEVLPDLLFVDQRYSQREGEIEKILSLKTHIVLIAGGNLSKDINILRDRFEDIIYKPINYSKVERMLLSHVGHTEKKIDTHQRISRFDGLHILVAEDNIINQKLIRSTLENFGIQVTIASNGEEAVSLRKQNAYDLIFMDVQMPVMNGMEATKQILEYEQTHKLVHIPIVALTANALKGDREKYLSSGMDDYTPKPLKIDLIKEIIRRYCPEKEYFVEEEGPEEPVSDSNEKLPKVPADKKHVLLYFTNALIRSIHVHMLDNIAECTVVESEAELLEQLESRRYNAVLIDSVLLPQDHCYFADLLEGKKISIHVFGEKDWVACPSIEVYETIRNIRERLHEEG